MSTELTLIEIELMASGVPWWLAREAAASTLMSQDEEGTYSLDEHEPPASGVVL